jgi:hypothetical protein
MIKQIALVVFLSSALLSSAIAADLEGEYLYKVSTVRAATGSLSDVLDWNSALKASSFFADAGEHPPFVMRHSQGDQWDLMILTPMDSWTSYHSASATRKRDAAVKKHAELVAPIDKMIAFDEDVFAYGPPLSVLTQAYDNNSFYHIEMFQAAPGKAEDLIEQRRMENKYLASTGQTENMIFRRVAGSDVDVFTIGFHKNLEAFAEPANITDEEKERAAKAAGFKGRADLSFYLRSLISGHHDTLAVKVD